MFRFAVRRTDTGFPRLLMLETVFTLCRRMREVIVSVHEVVAVKKNGMELCDNAYCVQMGAVSFENYVVERFCDQILKYLNGSFRHF